MLWPNESVLNEGSHRMPPSTRHGTRHRPSMESAVTLVHDRPVMVDVSTQTDPTADESICPVCFDSIYMVSLASYRPYDLNRLSPQLSLSLHLSLSSHWKWSVVGRDHMIASFMLFAFHDIYCMSDCISDNIRQRSPSTLDIMRTHLL